MPTSVTRWSLALLLAVPAFLVPLLGGASVPKADAATYASSVSWSPSVDRRYARGAFTLENGDDEIGIARLAFQSDGNLVSYFRAPHSSTWQVRWASNTSKKLTSTGYLVLQKDGNVVIYTGGSSNHAVWSTGTRVGSHCPGVAQAIATWRLSLPNSGGSGLVVIHTKISGETKWRYTWARDNRQTVNYAGRTGCNGPALVVL